MKQTAMAALGLGLLVTACSGNKSAETTPTSQTAQATQAPAAMVASPQAPRVEQTMQAQATRVGIVTADSLNIRQSPDTTASVLYTAPKGTQLEILGETARGDSLWYQVKVKSNQLPQSIGWAFSQYISVSGGGGVSPDRPPTNPASFQQGYQEGYKLGYRDGQNFKKYNSGNNPSAAYGGGCSDPNPNSNYCRGNREGFFAGFDAGYYGKPYNATPGSTGGTTKPVPPPTNSLSMTCPGTLSNGTKFTVYYPREAGFNRITLTTSSGLSNSANLTYSGKTEAQHGVWKGRLGESEVRVDHLSAAAPQQGDEIYVLYNQFTGRTTCR